MIRYHMFHSTSGVFQLPNHRLYKSVDWAKVEAGFHAVVDPVEPASILYLTEQDYIRQLRVSMSNDHTLKVLAKAGTSKLATSTTSTTPGPSQNSPRDSRHPYLNEFYTGSRKSLRHALKRVYHQFDTPFGDFLGTKRSFEGTVKALMIPVSDRNIRTLLVRWFDKLAYWKTGSKASYVTKVETNSFGLYLARVARTQGANAVIQRLKIGLFVLNSYVGGSRLTSTQDLGLRIRLVHGLPRYLPLHARQGIRSVNLSVIRIWSSMLNSYKVMEGSWKIPDLSSITGPHPDYSANDVFRDWKDFVPTFWKLLKITPIRSVEDLSPERRKPGRPTAYSIFFTGKSGPNRGPALLTVGADAYAWRCQPRNLILEWLTICKADITKRWFEDSASVWISDTTRISGLKENMSHTRERDYHGVLVTPEGFRFTEFRDILIRWWKAGPYGRPILRRLHALYEAAGKVRVIAIVDYWTQLVLKPLHVWMFECLKALPQDASFDQEGKLLEFSKRGYTEFYSYDLKSATDTIPLSLYKELLKPMIPLPLFTLWLELLVGLPFLVPKENVDDRGMSGLKNPTYQDVEDLHRANEVRYTCGQPMGALSSWASMALVHHALVWLAAFKCGQLREEKSPLPRWIHFTAYLVLGDDVVIANKDVAEAYSSICSSLGIKIGLPKSYISGSLMNFANQTYLKSENISPLSLREELNVKGFPSRIEMATRAVRRGWIDLEKNGWVAPLIKLFVHPITWEMIQKDLNRGVNHPLVSWILSGLLAPCTNKLSVVKPVASISEYLATMSRKVLFWNKPLKDLGTCESSKGKTEFLRMLLLKRAQALKGSYEQSLRLVEGFEKFLWKNVPTDRLPILLMAYQTTAKRRLEWWRREYLATVMLVISGPRHNLNDSAYAQYCDCVTLEELLQKLYDAEKELPVILSYEGKTIKDFFSSARVAEDEKVMKVFLSQMELLRATDEAFESAP